MEKDFSWKFKTEKSWDSYTPSDKMDFKAKTNKRQKWALNNDKEVDLTKKI